MSQPAPGGRTHPPTPSSGDEGSAWPWALLAGIGVLVLASLGGLAMDLDGDEVSAFSELGHATVPWQADTDQDGIDDGTEIQAGLDPLAPDTDDDGLPDRAELDEGTDPRSADTDGDELRDADELANGTDPRTSDTDEDTLSDGHERSIGTDPTTNDTDADGLPDPDELAHGGDPWRPDTDEDGLLDRDEAANASDCDMDGYAAIADADDDGDELRDADEDPAWRCRPDADGDGIRDGEERARVCVQLTDCDVDGLPDADEEATAFDRLNPDTYDVGLLDGVTHAFQQAGQNASRDADGDGIPDHWEASDGLISWRSFDPEPGRKDLLVEFVRVEGPDSARYGPGSMQPAYQQVASFFAEQGNVTVDWTQTRVRLDEERRPPLIPSSLDGYYGEVLRRAGASANPYVTTVVMNPQHDQSNVQHQGVAPIRGMLAAVDYGAHTQARFTHPNGTITISPYVESLVAADRLDRLERSGITGGGVTQDGRMQLAGEGWRLTWGPLWFAQPPVHRFDDGRERAYERGSVEVDQRELADTIAHELGHTLGLCHTNLPDCQAHLSLADRDEAGVSTMDPRRSGPELAFLDSEWTRLRGYLACPPQRSIAMLADGADSEALIDAKYEITVDNVLDVGSRECQERDPIEPDLDPEPDPRHWEPNYTVTGGAIEDEPTTYTADIHASPDTSPGGAGLTLAYAAGSLVASLAAAAGVARWRG